MTDERFAALCRAEHARLVGALSVYLGDRGVAEELAQEALWRAARRWERVGRLARPEAWVRRVALNLAASAWRRRQAERRALARHGLPGAEPDFGVAADRRADVRRALRAIPARQRAALVYRHWFGYSTAETAQALRTTPGAVKQLVARGTAALRRTLAEPEAEEVVGGDA